MANGGDPEAIAELAAAASCPPRALYLWRYFLQISRTRQNSGMGPSRLSRLDIRLWEADECVRLELWERRAIIDIDGMWVASMTQQIAAEQAADRTKPGS